MKAEYINKFESFREQTLFPYLATEQQAFIRDIAIEYRFTFQEFRQVAEACRDLEMWGEPDLQVWWETQPKPEKSAGKQFKKSLLTNLQTYLQEKRAALNVYPANGLPRPEAREKKHIFQKQSSKEIAGMCPVASEETVCCNLRTIDTVENCAFGCSYCTIQTFYKDKFTFDVNLAEKLKAIEIDPERFYHFGTGQSSDSLVWGNKFSTLETLCAWAAANANVLLEFKTKSNNVSFFLEKEVPPNLVCSWSLNTPTIIKNEEHFTANLEQRLAAARSVADRGMKVAFHFHPMVHYDGWDEDYPAIAARLKNCFDPDEVLFVSLGSITMIKPVMNKIRKNGHATKILQMEMTPDPLGKLTYPDDTKVEMFRTMHSAFSDWHERVFFYLCMEKATIWQRTFGFSYPDNETFERKFLQSSMSKLQTPEVFVP